MKKPTHENKPSKKTPTEPTTYYFWGAALELAFPSDLSFRCGSLTAGQQTVTPEDETYITGAWFHCVHVADHCQATTCHMWCSCEDWEPEYEMRKQQIDWHDL